MLFRSCHEDIVAQRTLTRRFWESQESNRYANACPFKTHQHYRMVTKEIAMPMTEFRNALELMLLIYQCVLGEFCASFVCANFP